MTLLQYVASEENNVAFCLKSESDSYYFSLAIVFLYNNYVAKFKI